jgi:hypothetical protein
MSYSFNENQCNYCERKDGDNPCMDNEKIREAISKIHMSQDGSHKGSGMVILQCHKQLSKIK